MYVHVKSDCFAFCHKFILTQKPTLTFKQSLYGLNLTIYHFVESLMFRQVSDNVSDKYFCSLIEQDDNR